MRKRSKNILQDNWEALAADKEKLLKYLPEDLLIRPDLFSGDKFMKDKIRFEVEKGFKNYHPETHFKRIKKLEKNHVGIVEKRAELEQEILRKLEERCDKRYYRKKYDQLMAGKYLNTYTSDAKENTETLPAVDTKYTNKPTDVSETKRGKPKKNFAYGRAERLFSKQIEGEKYITEKLKTEMGTENINRYIDSFRHFDSVLVKKRFQGTKTSNYPFLTLTP